MKSLYWNVRGLANAPSRLALKRFLNVHKPDFFALLVNLGWILNPFLDVGFLI